MAEGGPGQGDLLLGIGNPLRGDDGVAALLLEELAVELGGWTTPAAELNAVHQLTPELALAVAAARRVLFVDAWVSSSVGETSIERLAFIEPMALESVEPGWADFGGHLLDPRQLLALAHRLYSWQGEASLLRVPAFAFPHGTGFSLPLREGLPQARDLLRRWLRGGMIGVPRALRHG